TGKVQYIFKHRPLTRLHPRAKEQAIFMQCVAKNAGNNSFFDLTKKVFANQDAAKERSKMYDLASQVGVNKEAISSCVTDKETQGKVNSDSKIGAEIGVQGTPSFAIGTVKDNTLKGKLLVGAQPYSRFESLIDPILK
ncbi:MAG: DsbA family protein, partial [Candidatus Paceibacteria bacterium]